MDFQKLKTFRAVATLMNFNQAATLLNYAQSSVSAQIKTLEDEVGVPLFHRVGKKITLTEAGAKMLRYTHKLLAIEEEALAEIAGKSSFSRLLTIRMPQTIATYYMPDILMEFHLSFPEVHLDISSCAYHSLENELAVGTVDLAFLFTDSVDACDLEFELLKIERLFIVTGPNHQINRKGTVDIRALHGQTIFLPKADCGYRMMFEKTLTSKGIEPGSVIEMNSIEAIKKSVKKGLGLTVIPEIAVKEELENKELCRFPWSEELETGVCMIRHKNKWFSPALETFMEICRKEIEKNVVGYN